MRESTLKTIEAKIIFISLELALKLFFIHILMFFTEGQISVIADSAGVDLSSICL